MNRTHASEDRPLDEYLLFLLIAWTCLAACSSGEHTEKRLSPPDAATISVAATDVAPAPDGLSPLAGEWLEPLSDARGEVGFVAIPVGTTSKRPLVVALHGALDHPQMTCSEWRAMFGPEPFVICPYGERLNAKTYVWGDPVKLRASIDRAVAAAESRFPERVMREGAVWASYSQSGMLSAHALSAPGMPFRYAVLFEGVPRDLAPLRKAFQHAGIRRALFVNQQGGWSRSHAEAARLLGPDIDAKHILLGDGTLGHFMRVETFDGMRAALPWLTAGDPDWDGAKR